MIALTRAVLLLAAIGGFLFWVSLWIEWAVAGPASRLPVAVFMALAVPAVLCFYIIGAFN